MNHIRFTFVALALVLLNIPIPGAQSQADLTDGIERLLSVGRSREALQSLTTLRQIGDPSMLTPRFLFLEARAMLETGLIEEARVQIDSIRNMEGWEQEIDPTEMLTLELSVLKSLGQSADAAQLLESQLTPLDELDPPYSSTVTQLHLVYADLLLACLRNTEAVQILLDLYRNGDPRLKVTVAQSLVSAAEQQALSDNQWKILPSMLEDGGTTLWTQFSRAAFKAGKKEIARFLLQTGFKDNPSVMRAQWSGFLEDASDPNFLNLISGMILSGTMEVPAEGKSDWLAIKALTLERNGRIDEAIQIIRENLWGNIDQRLQAARMLASQGKIEDASKIYSELETESPGRYLDAWGSLLADRGMNREALAVWARIPGQDPRKDLGYLQWGRLLKGKGFLKEAIEAYKQGLAKSSQAAIFSQELLEVSISLGDVSGALTAYQALRSQAPRIGGTWSPERLVDQLRRTQQMETFSTKLDEVLAASDTVKAPWRDFAVEMATELALQLNRVPVLEAWLVAPPEALKAYWAKDPGRKGNHLMGIGLDLSLQGEHRLASCYFASVDLEQLKGRPNMLEAAARSNAVIGDLTASINLWQTLKNLPKTTGEQKIRAGLSMARLFLELYQPGKTLVVLKETPNIDRVPTYKGENAFLMAMAHTQLHEKSKAIPLLEDILKEGGSHAAEAMFWLAEWNLWQRDWGAAREGFQKVLSTDPGQSLANEALWRLRYMTGVEEDKLAAFSLACFFEGSGEWKESETNYRNLAAALGPSDLTDWIYYRIGKIQIESGHKAEGLQQWSLVEERSGNQTLVKRIRFEKAALETPSNPAVYEDIVLSSPNTLLGDLARERMAQPQPTAIPSHPAEMVP